MKEKIEEIKKSAEEQLEKIKNSKELQDLKVKFLGKKSELSEMLKSLGALSKEERRRRKNKKSSYQGKVRKRKN